ncbi:uncharacterized protein EHS24_005660 [Apiotrichum porosum]|uniref:Choline transporter n=1 Tax=Apiotrichum porosum TaxID=105984 RepID=A0A427XZ53_9TREE|nr:uncharacterized protein EHS24_005660 [Apiotrichum porosum]RSH84156.1 hypothetical protein EHS24_005660 [Apiotrichum porosum]
MSITHESASDSSPPSMGDKEKDLGGVRLEAVQTGGHVVDAVELERNFSFLSTLGLAFSLLNSWTAIAEICHVFPLSGGQYDFVYCTAPPRFRVGLSFFTGWMACAGWTTLLGAGCSLGSSFFTALISFWHPDYEPATWHVFMFYVAVIVGQFLLNVFGVRALPHLDRFGAFWSIAGIVTIIVTLLACSSGRYQSAKDVFGTLTNLTGWPDGMAFILGLLQSTLGFTAFDAASHMVEEMPNPSRNAPLVMILAVAMGAVTSWIFMVVLLFCLADFDAVIAAANGPLLEIYYQSTRSMVGSTCLMMFNLTAMMICVGAAGTVSSRMIMSFSRDRGFGHVSRFLSPVHARLKVPVYCLVFCGGWGIVFGLLYLGSSVAFNAILAVAILLLQISYITPIIIVFIRGEKAFAGHSRTYSLGRWRRVVNGLAIAFAVMTSVIFVFPPAIPVTSGSSMNYAIVAFAVVLIMCGVTWLVDGRKNFTGPRDLEERLQMGKNA